MKSAVQFLPIRERSTGWAPAERDSSQAARGKGRHLEASVDAAPLGTLRNEFHDAIFATHRLITGSIFVLMYISMSSVLNLGGVSAPFL